MPKALAYIDAALKRQQIRWTAENGIMAAVRHAKATQPDGVNISQKYTCSLTKLPLGKLLFKLRSRLHYVPKECYRELVELGWDLAGLRHHKWYKPNGLLTAFRSHSVKYGHINVRQDYVCPITGIDLGIRVNSIRCNVLHIPEECEHEMRQELHFWDSDAEYDWLNPVTGKMVAFRYAHKQLGHIDVSQTYRCPITKQKLGTVVSALRSKAKGDLSKTKVPEECHHELCVELRFYWKHEDRVPKDAKWEGPHGWMAAFRYAKKDVGHLNLRAKYTCLGIDIGAIVNRIRTMRVERGTKYVPEQYRHELFHVLRFWWSDNEYNWLNSKGYLAAVRLFYRKWQHLNVPQSFSCKLTQVPLGAKMNKIRCGELPMPPECMRELREKHFMFSPTNLFKHVYMCLQYDMPEVKQEDVRALDPWDAQVTPAEARLAAAIRRLLEEVSEQHPIWVQKADTRTFVPFGKKPLDVQQRYLADRQKAVSILALRHFFSNWQLLVREKEADVSGQRRCTVCRRSTLLDVCVKCLMADSSGRKRRKLH